MKFCLTVLSIEKTNCAFAFFHYSFIALFFPWIRSPSKDQEIKKPEPKKSENELHWEELVKNMTRPLTLCDLDFTDLHSEDDKDDMVPRGAIGSIPPPPPLLGIRIAPPMPRPMPPPTNLVPPPNFRQSNDSKPMENGNGIKKNKKTVSPTL